MSYDAKTWGSRSPFGVTSQRKHKPESNWLSTVWFLHVRLICWARTIFFTLTEWKGWLLHTVYDICLQGLIWRRQPEFSEAPPCPRRVAWLWSAQKALVRAVARPWLVSSDAMSHKPEGNSAAAAVGRLRMAVSAFGTRLQADTSVETLKQTISRSLHGSRADPRVHSGRKVQLHLAAWNWHTKILQLRGEAVEVLHYFGWCTLGGVISDWCRWTPLLNKTEE